MTVNYYFDDDYFEFDVDINDYLAKCSPEELVSIAKDYWDEGMSDEDKKQYIDEGITAIDDTVSSDDIADILADADEDWLEEHLKDDIEEAFEDDARELYNENKAFQSDPLGYYGMHASDFA